jgi:hypothetical protein
MLMASHPFQKWETTPASAFQNVALGEEAELFL